MEAQVAENIFVDRFLSILSTFFAIEALFLAPPGLYAFFSYSVNQRHREIGLPMALGADAKRVRTMILRQVGAMTFFGAFLGIGGGLGIGNFTNSLLYQIEGFDPIVLTSSAFAFGLVAFAAGLVPAQRAATVDPMRALRDD